MNKRRAVALSCLIGFASACGPAENGRPDATAVVRDSAGIEIVTNGAGQATTAVWIREVLRLGVLEGGGPEQFSQVHAVAMDEDGRLFVGNNGSVTVRAFDRDGAFLAEFGGRGQGPSELTMINDLIVADTTIALVDWQRGGKVNLFRKDGTFLDTWTLGYGARRVMPTHYATASWIALAGSGLPPDLQPGETWRPTRAVHFLDFGSDSSSEPVYVVEDVVLYGVEGTEMGVDWGLLPERTHVGFDAAGRLYRTDPHAYKVDIAGPDGPLRSVRRALDPRPFTDRDVEEIKAAAIHMVDTLSLIRAGGRAAERRRLIERLDQQARLPRPDFVPPLGPLLVSPDGSFWVERMDVHPPSYVAVELLWGLFDSVPPVETTWDLFGAEGAYRGSVVLPSRFRPDDVNGLEVVGVWKDDLDVEYVVKYEITSTPTP